MLGTDHLMVRSNLLMRIQPRSLRTASYKKLNCTALNSHTTKDTLRQLLDENLNKIPEESTDWPALRQAIYKAALEALGQLRTHHQDWFDSNSAEIQSLLKAKHEAHKALLSCPGSPTLITSFTAARAETQRALGLWRIPGGCKRRKKFKTWQTAITFKAFTMP